MNARWMTAPERGLSALIAAAVLASGVVFYVTSDRSMPTPPERPIVLEDVRVIVPTFRDATAIDPNTASLDELVRLPGIGEVLAGRIIEYREQHGRFASVEELTAVSGIGPAVLEAIRDRIAVEAEETPAGADQ